MLYVIHWYCQPEVTPKVFERFKKMGHNAPAGVKIVKATFTLHLHEGWAIVEANDPVAVGKFIHSWSDLNDHEVFPVVDEEGLRAIIGS
jgi:hypothetical protein